MRFNLSNVSALILGLLILTWGIATFVRAEKIRERSLTRWSFGVPTVFGYRAQAALMTGCGLVAVVFAIVDAIRR